jgi:hypothetical protein
VFEFVVDDPHGRFFALGLGAVSQETTGVDHEIDGAGFAIES